MVNAHSLHGTWYHSHEEDEPGCMVLRRQGYDFPPSRGRMGYAFEADGSARLLGPGPDDRTTSKIAKWSLSPEGTLTIEAPDGDRQVLSIRSTSPERIVLNN